MSGRQALVVGANAYPGMQLVNPFDDARRVGAVMAQRGFAVTYILDPDGAAIDAALAAFGPPARTAEIAMVFLAGHAVERYGSGYFIPTDFSFPVQPSRLAYTAVSLNAFVDATAGAGSRIVVLDACRNWPHEADEAMRTSNDLNRLIAEQRDWPDLLFAYLTSATRSAGDGMDGDGSAFANAICRHLLDHSLTVDECFRRVAQDVIAVRPSQQPWTYSSLARTLSFTDLPRFAPIQRLAVPNPERLGGGWTAPSGEDGGIIVGVDDALAWHVDMAGLEQVRHPGGDRLMGAACAGHLFLAGSQGGLYAAGTGRTPMIDLGMRHPHGMSASVRMDGRRTNVGRAASRVAHRGAAGARLERRRGGRPPSMRRPARGDRIMGVTEVQHEREGQLTVNRLRLEASLAP